MTNEELTTIYNEANGLDPKRFNAITTDRIFAAMRAAMATEREACAKVCDERAKRLNDGNWTADEWDTICGANELAADDIRARSNVGAKPKTTAEPK